MEAQRAQSAMITSLSETKEFDKIKTTKGGQRQNLRKLQTCAKIPAKQSCSCCGSSHPTKQCPTRSVWSMTSANTSEWENKTIYDLEREQDQYHEEDPMDTVNIKFIIFNNKWSVITADLKTSSNQVSIMVSYKVDTGSDGKIMPLHLYKRLFPRVIKEHLTATKNKNIKLTTYSRTIITQSGICKVKIGQNNKQQVCKFFVVSGNGQALLGMHDITMLNIINWNTMET